MELKLYLWFAPLFPSFLFDGHFALEIFVFGPSFSIKLEKIQILNKSIFQNSGISIRSQYVENSILRP
jgi:hypothetical protein